MTKVCAVLNDFKAVLQFFEVLLTCSQNQNLRTAELIIPLLF